MSYSITKMIVSKWGKHLGIAPKTDGSFEVYNKRDNILLGKMYYHISWKAYVWQDQPEDVIMSKDCLDEAFKLVEEHIKEVIK